MRTSASAAALLAFLLAMGLVGPIPAVDASPAHHGRHHHGHQISALVAPAVVAGTDRHADLAAITPSTVTVEAPVGSHARNLDRAGVGTADVGTTSARGPPAGVAA